MMIRLKHFVDLTKFDGWEVETEYQCMVFGELIIDKNVPFQKEIKKIGCGTLVIYVREEDRNFEVYAWIVGDNSSGGWEYKYDHLNLIKKEAKELLPYLDLEAIIND